MPKELTMLPRVIRQRARQPGGGLVPLAGMHARSVRAPAHGARLLQRHLCTLSSSPLTRASESPAHLGRRRPIHVIQVRAAATATGSGSRTPTAEEVGKGSPGHTAAQVFLETLSEAGVTQCFVNLGSDHPGLIEMMVRERREKKGRIPRIITVPNEMVALSMADGFARLTRRPQAVIVHTDVGTQGVAAAMHNASTGRAPVLLFAGLSPLTCEGELRGSRTEFVQWLQDVPDQKQIVAQYCRYTGELKVPATVRPMVRRALQVARSAPAGPVYLCAAREILEAEAPVAEPPRKQFDSHAGAWDPTILGGLPAGAADEMARALARAERPLVVAGYAGRNHAVPGALVELAERVPRLRVLDTGGCDMCFPADHAAWRGLRFGVDETITQADVLLVLDCDVPWIPTLCRPREGARIFHVDVDPLKRMMPVFWLPAEARYQADVETAVRQVLGVLDDGKVVVEGGSEAREARTQDHMARLMAIREKAEKPQADGTFGTGYLCSRLRELCPLDTIWAIEAVTNTQFVHDSIRPTRPGSWINCGGGGLGWSGGGALGIKLAADEEARRRMGQASRRDGGACQGNFVVQIVGDGSYLFSVPGSVYWTAKRYQIPVLTIVLNNGGWNSPRRSLLLVHPDGEASTASNEDLNISLEPSADHSGIAKAAAGGDLFAEKVEMADELDGLLKRAIDAVQGGQSAVLDCRVVKGC